MPGQLAKKVRDKYPGQYDDLDDATLEKMVLAKYPEYKDLADEKPAPVQASLMDKLNTPVQSTGTEQLTKNANFIQQMRYANPNQSRLGAQISGFAEGAMEGVKGLMTPLNLGFSAAGAAEAMPIAGVARAGQLANKALSLPVAAEGAYHVSQGRYGQGAAELAGGLLGLRGRMPVAAEGRIPTPNVDIPNPIEVRPRALPPGQYEMPAPSPRITTYAKGGTPIVREGGKFTPKIEGDVPYSGSSNVPAEIPQRYPNIQSQPMTIESQAVKSEPIISPEVSATPHHLGSVTDVKQPSTFSEAVNLPRALKSSLDLSAPMRQGFPLIGRKEWWKNLPTQLEAWKSEKGFKAIQDEIASRPNFRREIIGGKEMPSFAEQAGLKLTDLTDLSSREESLMSTWAEQGIPLPTKAGKKLQSAYAQTMGRGVRASNRAYTAFLNKLRADTFDSMIADLDKAGHSISNSPGQAKDIASFVNDATGRGHLGSLEKHAVLLNNAFFSPRLVASRVRMYNRLLNPVSYAQASPQLRKEALRSLLGMTGAGMTMLSLLKAVGAEVSTDPNSSDFGKAKIGNTRVDPWAGFQQYAVLASRLLSGQETSSTTGETKNLGEGFGTDTRKDVIERFAINKTHPTWKFAIDLMSSKDYRPFNIPKEAAMLFVPMVAQDLYELSQEDPSLLTLAPLAISGVGVQTYGGQ